jgi:hypothetical protein
MRLCWVVTLLLYVLISSFSAEAASVRIVLAQLGSSDFGEFGKVLIAGRSAKAGGAEIIVFPEADDMGWLSLKTFFDAAEYRAQAPSTSRTVQRRLACGSSRNLRSAANRSRRRMPPIKLITPR